MKYLIETSVIIQYLRDIPQSVALVNSLDGELVSSTICLAELSEGTSRYPDQKLVDSLKSFFNGLSIVYPVDDKVARRFGIIRNELRASGRLIEDLDILIAATCLEFELTIVTANPKHFSRIRGLSIIPVKI